MSTGEKQMKTVQKQLEVWAKKAKTDYPEQLEHTVRSAVDRLDPAAIARASEDVISTVTGNRKTARRARKAIEKSLSTAQRKAGTKRCKHKALTVLAIVAVIGIVGAMAVRRATRQNEEVTKHGQDGADRAKSEADPDINK